MPKNQSAFRIRAVRRSAFFLAALGGGEHFRRNTSNGNDIEKLFASLALAFTFAWQLSAALPEDYVRPNRSRSFTRKIFCQSPRAVRAGDGDVEPPASEARWVFFRNADTLWRSQFATQTADTTKIDPAREWWSTAA